ncbi:ornithine cyclodeaminase family protein [Bordetella genomosp. 6]|uniref:ornithine cyclodeaminase family protein n=1 Tax=Bordetella genomosp. 6 TaxID=463024 RepID=UPI000A29061D|nr:ornithine cyclodeaminase family protein [Bordetella genomosp. 6]ARP77587.1 ornithine cyclodeaminase [Bordetella genomosp. 6]
MLSSAIWLSEENITALVSLKEAIGVLETGVRALGTGEGFNIPKALGAYGDASSMHSLGSALPEAGFCGYKNWINTPRGAKAVYVLFDAREGRLLAIMEANALGQMRTSAMTGLGTKWVARPGADDMAIIGTGRQALAQVAAVHAVRPLSRIRVWSPTPENRRAFFETLREQFDTEVVVADSLAQACDGASIVTTVTRAREPFLDAGVLGRGVHLNAVGAILPHSAEFSQDVFARVGFIAVDDVSGAQKASREFIDYFEQGPGKGDWSRVRPLGEVIAGGEKPAPDCDISLFKAMGMGISDLSVAVLAYQRAKDAQVGQSISLMASAPIRLPV